MLLSLMGVIKHSQITQSNKFAISLQYLKKEVRNGGHFWHADKSLSFYKLVLSFLREVAIHVQNAENRKLVIFSQYIKKNCQKTKCDTGLKWANHEECFKKLLDYWYCVFYQGFLSIHIHFWIWNTTHKMKFFLKSFFSKCEKIRGKKSLTWNTSFFCIVEIIKLTFVWNIWFE